MTLLRTLIYKLKRLKSFSLIEVLVALSIMGVITVSTLSVFINMNRYLFQDKDVQAVIDFSEHYFYSLYFSDDLKAGAFQAPEISNLNKVYQFPVLLPPLETNISPTIKVLINRKVERWEPLLMNIGLEAMITPPENKKVGNKIRHYWIETTLSSSYLAKLK